MQSIYLGSKNCNLGYKDFVRNPKKNLFCKRGSSEVLMEKGEEDEVTFLFVFVQAFIGKMR